MNVKKRRELILEYLNHKGERSVEQIHNYVCSKIIGPYSSENMLRKIYRDIDALEKSGELLKKYYDVKTGFELEDVDNKKRYIMKCHSVTDNSFVIGDDLVKDLEINFVPSFNKPEAWKISIVKDKKHPSVDSFCFVFKFKEKYICIEANSTDAPLSIVIAGKSSCNTDSDYLIKKFGKNAALIELPLETLVPIDSMASGHFIIHFISSEIRGEEFVRVNQSYKLAKEKFNINDDLNLFNYLKEDLKSGWVSWSRANDFIEDANFEGILNHFQSDTNELTWFEKKKLAENKGDVGKLIATPRPKEAKVTYKIVAPKKYEVKESRLSVTNSFYKVSEPCGSEQRLPLRVLAGGLEFIAFVAYKNPKELILKTAA